MNDGPWPLSANRKMKTESAPIMNSFTIVCPHCKSEIPLNEAVTHQVQEQLEADFKQRQALLQKSLAQREKQLDEKQASLEKSRLEVDTQVAQKLAAERSKVSAAALAEAKLSLSVEMQDLRDRLEERQKQLQEPRCSRPALAPRESRHGSA
jgi:hypothetical protein